MDFSCKACSNVWGRIPNERPLAHTGQSSQLSRVAYGRNVKVLATDAKQHSSSVVDVRKVRLVSCLPRSHVIVYSEWCTGGIAPIICNYLSTLVHVIPRRTRGRIDLTEPVG
jgi:hypothetical protein